MNQQDLERFETEVAEIVGAMKELFKEFEKRLGEVVSAQRVASSEARAEGAQLGKDLQELGRSARVLVGEQRDLLARIEREWQLRIDHNAQRAGEVQAQAFGESIARGRRNSSQSSPLMLRAQRNASPGSLPCSGRWGSPLLFRSLSPFV